MLSAECPKCGAALVLPSQQIGLKVNCDTCRSTLEIVAANGGTILLGIVVNTTCPECAGTLTLKPDVQQGEIVVCGDCGVDLEVVSTTPTITLALAPTEQEDWGE